MLSDHQTQRAVTRIRIIQMIALSMMLGAVVMFALICFIFVDLDNLNEVTKMLTIIGAVAGVLFFSISIVLPRLFTTEVAVRSQEQREAEERAFSEILTAIMTENIARYALIEAGLILNVIVLMLEPHRVTLVILGIGLLIAAVFFPRKSALLQSADHRFQEFQTRTSNVFQTSSQR